MSANESTRVRVRCPERLGEHEALLVLGWMDLKTESSSALDKIRDAA